MFRFLTCVSAALKSGRSCLFFAVCVLLICLLTVTSALRVSAESLITLDEANVSFVPIEGWIGVTRSGMEQSVLDSIPITKSAMTADFEENNGYYFSVDSTRMHELFVSSSSDNRSEKIFSTVDGDYSLISEYLSNPAKYRYMARRDRLDVVKSTEKLSVENAVFYVVEYKLPKGSGICYSAVVNGRYISFDFRCKSGEFTDTEKIYFVNLMRSVSILNAEERERLDNSQIIIIGGVGFLLLLLIIGIVSINAKKKKKG